MYKIEPTFREQLLQSIGTAPFNQVAPIFQYTDNIEEISHEDLSKLIQTLSGMPYYFVAPLLNNYQNYFTEIK